MFTDLKKFFKSFLVLAVSLFFWPTVVQVFSTNSPMGQAFFSNLNTVSRLLGVLFLLASAVVGVLIIYKEKTSDRILAEATDKDRFWNKDEMTLQIKSVFYKVQSAWEGNDITCIKNYATVDFLDSFSELLKTKNENSHVIDTIEISEAQVIGSQDFINNKNDKFIGYIKGSFGTTAIDPQTNEPIRKEFSEMYHFIRGDDDWMLDSINYKVGIWNLLSIKDVCE
ncbi:MAG TPA: hypothetical protein VK718_04445 [Ferruginibacter sp.]|jgi:hypothetical protein|nr:hypothetical protein [Ferruginibacter sp.]